MKNGLKGLMYKEFFLRRKNLVIGLLIWLAFFVLTVSICLSRDLGNLKNMEDFNDSVIIILTYAAVFIIMAIAGDSGDSVYSDAGCHWDRFEYTAPVTAETAALTKMLTTLASLAAGFVTAVFSTAVIMGISHKSFALDDFKNLTVIFAVTLLMTVVSTYLKLKYKDASKVGARIVVMFALPYGAAMIWGFIKLTEFMDKMNMTDEEAQNAIFNAVYGRYAAVRDGVFPFLILIIAAIIIGGYFLFLKQIKRREN